MDKKEKEEEEWGNRVLKRLQDKHAIATKEILGEEPWQISELGDGNINYIYKIEGPKGSAIAKRAPPYIRIVGPDWPLGEKRILYERWYLEIAEKLAGAGTVPKIYLFDDDEFFILMENLSSCAVFRTALAKNGEKKEVQHENFGRDIGLYLARVLFGTSGLALTLAEQMEMEAKFRANELRGTTEQVIFDDPYREADMNGWKDRVPDLQDLILEFQKDKEVLEQAMIAREQFRCHSEALLHGDLHTGSIFIGEGRLVVFDAEFAFYGPMAFDTGLFLGNMLIACASQKLKNGEVFAAWMLGEIKQFWSCFITEFKKLWDSPNSNVDATSLFPKPLVNEELEKFQSRFLEGLLEDTIRFAAMVMARRVIGIADASEFRGYDSETRAAGEKPLLEFAMWVLQDLARRTSEDELKSLDEYLEKFEELCGNLQPSANCSLL